MTWSHRISRTNILSSDFLVPVMFWFIRPINRNAKIFSLISTQNGELHAQLFQMQTEAQSFP